MTTQPGGPTDPLNAPSLWLVYDGDAGVWRPEYPASALSVISADYRWTTDLAAVTAGQVGIDTADPAAATLVRIHRSDSQGRDTGGIIEQLDAGAWVNVQDRTDAAVVHKYDATGVPVLVGEFYELPVLLYSTAGTLANNARVSLVMRFTALPPAGA